MTENVAPVQLGYEGMRLLKVDDEILYKVASVDYFSRAVVTREPGTMGIFLKLMEDHSGERFNYAAGEEICGGANELYYQGDKTAARLLEGLLNEIRSSHLRLGWNTREDRSLT